MHTYPFVSDGLNLTPYELARIARSAIDPTSGAPLHKVAISPASVERVVASRAIVDNIVERGDVVYGITTGFGAFKDRVIPADELAALQVNLVLSHCVGVGDPLPTEVVRAMLLSRAHTLSLGYSGLRLETLQLIYSMLNAGIHPIVPEQGSVGASGDLAPLAHMALTMIGQGEVEWQGITLPAAEALRAAGLEPVTLGPKEGVALSNGTSLMSALLTLVLVDTAMLCDTADVVGAMSLEALQGVPAAFDSRIHEARGHNGQVQTAANIRLLTQGSTLVWNGDAIARRVHAHSDGTGDPVSHAAYAASEAIRLSKVQDAYSLRCMAQVHGPVRDAASYVEGVLTTELNSANDNPLIFGDVDDYAVLSGGNFHGAPLSVAADFLGIALCGLGTISERRQARMVDPSSHGGLFPAFLTDHGGVNSGYMIIQYTAAALASENKSLAHPASVDTIPTSANAEDHVSMGPIAGRHARAIAANTTRILALEALMAAQAIDFRLRDNPNAALGLGTRIAYDTIRSEVPFIERDVHMHPYIAAVEAMVKEGRIAAALGAARMQAEGIRA